MRLLLTFLFLFLTVNLFPRGNTQPIPEPVPPPSQLYMTMLPVNEETSRAEQIMRALFKAYPRKIDKIEYRNGDWAVFLRGIWFYFAGGRILPEHLLPEAESFTPQPFFNYPRELPPWSPPSAEEAARIQSILNNRRNNPPRRSTHFFDTLWRMHNRDEAYQRVKTMRFLRRPINVHPLIMENLALVEEHIFEAARKDPQVQAWINSLGTVQGWNWRDIAETQSRSFHAYGVAIDILPRSLGGKETYWLWASRRRADWWNIPFNARYHPPRAVIEAFKRFGFIWGGKWLFFDTMHFEYRPEILILNGMPPETRR